MQISYFILVSSVSLCNNALVFAGQMDTRTHTTFSTASVRKVHSSLLISKDKNQGAKPPLCAFAGQSAAHFTACPVTACRTRDRKTGREGVGSGKGDITVGRHGKGLYLEQVGDY